MNQLQIFNNPKFGTIRTITEDGKTLFCGSDVARALGYKKPSDAIAAHCRYTVKRSIPHPQAPDKSIEMLFIPEGDIYRLAAKSELPGADEFEGWIFDEVLPSIRKTGSYTYASKEIQAIFMLDARTMKHEERITALEGNMVIDYAQQRTLASQVSKAVIDALGGAASPAYRDKNVRGRTYSECNHDIQKWFIVNSRNNIPRKRFDEAVEYIRRWRPSTNMSMLIWQINQQIQIHR